MNLPNQLTILRILMIPLFLFFFFADFIPYNYTWALLVFALAALTDLIDGKIARARGLVTDFGKLMDPLADKLLTVAAFCCLFANLLTAPFISISVIVSLVLILSREFLVTSVRLLAAGKGEVLAADLWGKVKTVLQMLWIGFELLGYILFTEIGYGFLPEQWSATYRGAMYIFLYIMVAVTVLSGAHYIVKNRALFRDM